MHCIKQNADQLYRVRRGNDQPFTLVVRRSPEGYELGEGKGEQLSPEELHELSVTIYEPNSGEGFTPEIRYFGNALGFELSRVHTERYGLGIYEVEVSFTLDGEGGRTLRAPLCLVVKEGAHITAQNHQIVLDLAPIAKGERGDRGQSAYEAYLDNTDDDPKMSEAEWIRSFKSVDQRMREAKGYTDARVNDLSNSVANAREAIRTGLRGEADRGDAATLKGAKNYADGKIAEAKSYTDAKTAEKTEEAKNYARTWNKYSNTFDLSALDASKYYACIVWLSGTIYKNPNSARIRVYCGIGAAKAAPTYATHTNGFALQMEWTVNGEAFGGREAERVITGYQTRFVQQGEEVCSAPRQRTEISAEYVYLRGGYVYMMDVWTEQEPRGFFLAEAVWSAEGYAERTIASPVTSVTPPKAIYKELRDELREGDRATLEGAKSYADGLLARGRSEVHEEINILKTQLAGKMQHFVGSVVPTGYRKGDLWTLTADWTSFKAGSVLVAGADELPGRYTPSHWQELWGFRREVVDAIGSLQLGGRNYAKGTAGVKEGSGYMVSEYRVGAPWVAGVDYTVSFVLGSEYPDMLADLYVDGWSRADCTMRPEGTPTQGADGLYYARYSATFRTAQERIDLSVKRIAGGNGGFRLYKTRRLGGSDQGRYSLSRVMLERGNKASDWSPAPEDVDTAIAALEGRIAALEAKTSGG